MFTCEFYSLLRSRKLVDLNIKGFNPHLRNGAKYLLLGVSRNHVKVPYFFLWALTTKRNHITANHNMDLLTWLFISLGEFNGLKTLTRFFYSPLRGVTTKQIWRKIERRAYSLAALLTLVSNITEILPI